MLDADAFLALAYLAGLWHEGQHVAAFLLDEIWQQGYRGSKRSVRRQVTDWRTAEPPPPANVLLPGPRTLAWLLLRRLSDLDDKEQLMLKQLGERSTELGSARQLAQHFLRLVRERRGRELDAWTAEVFAGVRLRTNANKRLRTPENALYLAFKLVLRLSLNWRGINAPNQLRLLLTDHQFS